MPEEKKLVRVTIDGTTFPAVDMNDLTLGEQEMLERVADFKFDEDGRVTGGNNSGFTIGALYIAWSRADPRSATIKKVRELRQSQYDVEEVEAEVPPGVAAGAEVLTLGRPGHQVSPGATESSLGMSTG